MKEQWDLFGVAVQCLASYEQLFVEQRAAISKAVKDPRILKRRARWARRRAWSTANKLPPIEVVAAGVQIEAYGAYSLYVRISFPHLRKEQGTVK